MSDTFVGTQREDNFYDFILKNMFYALIKIEMSLKKHQTPYEGFQIYLSATQTPL